MFHKVFEDLKSCNTSIQKVIVEINEGNITDFSEGTINLLDKIPQFDSVMIKVKVEASSLSSTAFQAIESNFKLLTKMKAIKSISLGIWGTDKDRVTRNIYDVLIEGISYCSSSVRNLELQALTAENFEYLISLLIQWNSNLKLVTFSVFTNIIPYCCDKKRCHEFCNSLSTFLSKNASLRQIDISLPFNGDHIMSCIDTIQSGLDQNFTLKKLTIRQSENIIFQRNKHTVSANNKLDDSNHPVAIPQSVGMSSTLPLLGSQTLCRDSESSCKDDDVDSFPATPVKRVKLGTSSEEIHIKLIRFMYNQVLSNIHIISLNLLPCSLVIIYKHHFILLHHRILPIVEL